MPAYREQLRRQIVTQRLLMSTKGEILNAVRPPTEAEIVQAYTLNSSQFVRPESVRFSIIQIPFEPDRTRARETANRLIQEIGTDPVRFDQAVLRANAPNSGYMAGDGGYLPRNQQAMQVVGQEFMNAAFSLRQGQVSSLIEGNGGFQIIKITENHPQALLTLDDIFQLGSTMTVRDYIGNMMFQERQQQALQRATQELINELRRGNPFQVFENNINW
jgi:parvulin-like peptidyl-prolyl isomerase